MNRAQALSAFRDTMLPLWVQQCDPLTGAAWLMDRWYRGEQAPPQVPVTATPEYTQMAMESRSPWGALLVTAPAQQLYVEGYRTADDDAESPGWSVWQANKLDSRQSAIHRAAIAHGISYAVVLPGTPRPLARAVLPSVRGYSALSMVALYGEFEDWPIMALHGRPGPDSTWAFTLYDDQDIHFFTMPAGDPTRAQWLDSRPHGAPCCPVVRYASRLDLNGRSEGEIRPVIAILSRLDRDVFDRLTAQRKASWKIRYATGMAKPETDEEREAIERVLAMGDVLVNESVDAKFGTLDSTDLKQFTEAEQADLRTLAAITQIPPAQLLGQIANLSAEALAAAEAQLSRKVDEFEHSFGEAHEQVLSLSEWYLNGSYDEGAQVRWKDMGSRSLAATADALGKLAQMLGVPVQMLWEAIPGWTQQDVERAKALAAENDSLGQLTALLGQQSTTASGLTVPAAALPTEPEGVAA